MIEKLDVMKDTRNVIDKGGIVHTVANFTAIEKINEIVGTVNKLQTTNTHIQNDLHEMRHSNTKTRAENVQDKFAEQRKWIGKLCRFWDDGCVSNYISLLKQIDDDDTPFVDDKGVCWNHCEPVKPDDDIIYKGV